MPGPDIGLGKIAEGKIREWLDRPEDGYSLDRIMDQMTGYYRVSRNICDFHCFCSPNMYYIESKSTWEDRFEFALISDTQYNGLLEKSKIANVFGLVIVLFASHKRAIILDIRDIDATLKKNKHSVNIKKLASGIIPYAEITTIPNNRKTYLDYSGELSDYMEIIADMRNSLGGEQL